MVKWAVLRKRTLRVQVTWWIIQVLRDIAKDSSIPGREELDIYEGKLQRGSEKARGIGTLWGKREESKTTVGRATKEDLTEQKELSSKNFHSIFCESYISFSLLPQKSPINECAWVDYFSKTWIDDVSDYSVTVRRRTRAINIRLDWHKNVPWRRWV